MENNQIGSGMLSDADIKTLMKDNEIVITNFFDEENLTPLGYNLTPTDFILSIKNQLLVEIHNEELEKYCYIDPHDTVLILGFGHSDAPKFVERLIVSEKQGLFKLTEKVHSQRKRN